MSSPANLLPPGQPSGCGVILAALNDPAFCQKLRNRITAIIHRARPRGDRTDLVDEVFQAVSMRALQKCERYDPNRAVPLGWMSGIAKKIVQEHRRRMALNQSDLDSEEWEANLARLAVPSANGEVDNRLDISRFLTPLSLFECTLVELRYLKELDYPEIAALTGLSDGAIRVRLHRILKRLR